MTIDSVTHQSTEANDFLTLLTCRKPNARACKHWRTDGTEAPPSLGTRFDATTEPVSSLSDMHALLMRLVAEPQRFPIFGELKAPKERLNIERKSKGPTASFKPAKHHLIILDFDSVLWKGNIDPANPRLAVEEFLATIPQFRNVELLWQVTGSWGVKAGLRLRVFLWSVEALSLGEQKQFALSLPYPVDTSIYTAVTPIYTAAPLFEDKGSDPCPAANRIGYVDGLLDAVYVPTGNCYDELGYWSRRIEQLGSTGAARHPIVNSAAFFLGGWVASGAIESELLTDKLVEACEDSGAFDAERLVSIRDEISRAILDGAKVPRAEQGWREGLIRTGEGVIKCTVSNALLIVGNHPSLKDKLRLNVRGDKVEWTAPAPWDSTTERFRVRQLSDADAVNCAGWLNQQGLHACSKTLALQALETVAQAVQYDAVREYLNCLPRWDGKARVERLFIDGAGCEDKPIHKEVARCLCVAAVARVYHPGCKHELVPVLLGPQGSYKSTFWRVLFTGPGVEYFTDSPGDVTDVRAWVETTHRAWCVEDAELQRTSVREIEAVKRLVSAQVDIVRPAYAALAREFPRRNVLVGSTNDDFPLADVDNRRWFVLRSGEIDTEWVEYARDQIWAEAKSLYEAGVTWYLDSDYAREQRDGQKEFIKPQNEAWTGLIGEWLEQKFTDTENVEVTTADVLTEPLQFSRDKIKRSDEMIVARILRNLGFERVRKHVGKNFFWVFRFGGEH